MGQSVEVKIPDIGGAVGVDVIEILVKYGDAVAVDDALVTLEGDKASMEVPSTAAGVVSAIRITVGDKVSEGCVILELDTGAAVSDPVDDSASLSTPPREASLLTSSAVAMTVPDIGDAKDVDVIEVHIQAGDAVEVETPLLTLEGDKATMEVPAERAGVVEAVSVKVGDKVSCGSVIGRLQVDGGDVTEVAMTAEVDQKEPEAVTTQAVAPVSAQGVHASPAVRRIARELDIDLSRVSPTGAKNRITKEDVKRHLGSAGGGAGLSIASQPAVDFSQFGAVETVALSKIKKLSGANLHRNWVSIPHVTQFEQADVTVLERFRREQKQAAAAKGIKLTPIVFIMKALVASLKAFPAFNSSLDARGENVILKSYYHIGVAVDTPNGLVVPVIRDVDRKSLYELAQELGAISQKAREKGLSIKEMQGGCMTISSLGGIGGTAFTPIINAPEVAILGVSRLQKTPVYNEAGDIEPRLMMPLSLSYDHRVIDGAEAARFVVHLSSRLADIRTLLL